MFSKLHSNAFHRQTINSLINEKEHELFCPKGFWNVLSEAKFNTCFVCCLCPSLYYYGAKNGHGLMSYCRRIAFKSQPLLFFVICVLICMKFLLIDSSCKHTRAGLAGFLIVNVFFFFAIITVYILMHLHICIFFVVECECVCVCKTDRQTLLIHPIAI